MARGTPIRNVRVPDDLWNAAKDRAQAEGRSVTDVVVEALRQYTGQDKVHRYEPK